MPTFICFLNWTDHAPAHPLPIQQSQQCFFRFPVDVGPFGHRHGEAKRHQWQAVASKAWSFS